MSYLDNIKALASELANMAPKTQMELIKLCKELCINTKNYLVAFDEITLPALNASIEALETAINNLDASYNALAEELETAEGNITANANAINTINDAINTIQTALSNVYTKSQIDTMLASFYTKNQIDTMLANYYNKTEIDMTLLGKQDKLTAGTGISIVNDVISATGGGVSLYKHNIQAYINSQSDFEGDSAMICFIILSNSATPFDTATLKTYLSNNAGSNNPILCTPIDTDMSSYLNIAQLYNCTGFDTSDNAIKFFGSWQSNANNITELDTDLYLDNVYNDNVKQIL